MKRIFIAVRVVPEEGLAGMISSFKKGLSGEKIKWTDTGNIHITLAFPGNTDESLINGISRMLAEKSSHVGEFEIVIRGAGIFKSLSDPRIIWAGMEKSEKLSAMAKAVADGLHDLGINLEDRPYNPHLTIGRIKHIADKEALERLMAAFSEKQFQTVHVREVILYESILKQSGPVYKPLGVFSLLPALE